MTGLTTWDFNEYIPNADLKRRMYNSCGYDDCAGTFKKKKEIEFLPENSLKSMDYTNVGASLRIMGDYLDVQRITDTLKVKPSQTWYKGDPIRNTGKRHKYTAWVYNTKVIESLDLQPLLNQIMKLFSPQVDSIVALKKQYELDISIDLVVVIENEQTPDLYFEPEFLKFASDIGARLDIDTYVN